MQDNDPNYPIPMPEKYAREMVADWAGAGRAITGKWETLEWYEKNQEKILFSKLLFNKINKKYLDSSYINLNNKELKDPTKKFEINDFKTNIIGQSIVYSYYIEKPSFLIESV